MKAAVLKEYGKIVPSEVKDPVAGRGEVLVKVEYASICGSDQHIYKGEFHPRTRVPLIPGHEFAGYVASVGEGITDWKEDDKVTVDPIIPCGKCAACARKHYPACTSLKLTGIDMDGGFAQYLAVPEKMLYHIPENVKPEYAALVELLSIGFHASSRAGLQKDESVVIWGAGKVGQAILHAAKTLTSGRIIMADILQPRLEMAKTAFPDIEIVNLNEPEPYRRILDLTEGKGADLAFEAVGHFHEVAGLYNPVRSCVQVIRGGGRVCVLGLGDEPVDLLMKELIWKEARIIASRVSHGEFSEAIRALESGDLNPHAMITSVMEMDEADKAFQLLDKEPEKHLKILLRIP